MQTTTLAQARARVRQAADVQGYEDRHPNSEIDGYINRSRRKLIGKLARKKLIKDTITQPFVANGAVRYSLPDDFLAMCGVFEEVNNGLSGHRELEMRHPGEHPFGRPSRKGRANRYGLAEQDGVQYIDFLPQPTNGTYVYVYVPVPEDLVNDNDEMTSILAHDEWVILDAAIAVVSKDGLTEDVRNLQSRLAIEDARIDNDAANQDLMKSFHIKDVRKRPSDFDDGWGADFNGNYWGYGRWPY